MGGGEGRGFGVALRIVHHVILALYSMDAFWMRLVPCGAL